MNYRLLSSFRARPFKGSTTGAFITRAMRQLLPAVDDLHQTQRNTKMGGMGYGLERAGTNYPSTHFARQQIYLPQVTAEENKKKGGKRVHWNSSSWKQKYDGNSILDRQRGIIQGREITHPRGDEVWNLWIDFDQFSCFVSFYVQCTWNLWVSSLLHCLLSCKEWKRKEGRKMNEAETKAAPSMNLTICLSVLLKYLWKIHILLPNFYQRSFYFFNICLSINERSITLVDLSFCLMVFWLYIIYNIVSSCDNTYLCGKTFQIFFHSAMFETGGGAFFF